MLTKFVKVIMDSNGNTNTKEDLIILNGIGRALISLGIQCKPQISLIF